MFSRALRGLEGQSRIAPSGGARALAFAACFSACAFGPWGCAEHKPAPAPPKPAETPLIAPPEAPIHKVPAKPDGVALYFPHSLGDSWQMVMKGEETSEKLNLSIATGAQGGPGADPKRFYLITRRGADVLQQDGYVADEKGLSFVSSGVPDLSRVQPPMQILRLPVTSGDHWDWKGKFRSAAGDLEADGAFVVAGPEKVSTPAGSFEAFKVEQRVVVHASPDVVTATTMWLAPHVGLVKQVVETPDHKGEALVSAYKVAKPQ